MLWALWPTSWLEQLTWDAHQHHHHDQSTPNIQYLQVAQAAQHNNSCVNMMVVYFIWTEFFYEAEFHFKKLL